MSEPKRWNLLWRGVVFVASALGIFSLVVFLNFIAGPSEGNVALLAVVPLVAGLVAAMAPMEPRTRTLMLWIASVMLAIVSILSVTYGIGLTLFMVVAAYVMATWMLNEVHEDDPPLDVAEQTGDATQIDGDDERFRRWQWISLMASAAGFAGVAIVWSTLDTGPGYLALCTLPLLIGLVSAIGKMETQNRILLLWAAAALSGLAAALTIFSGAGLILLAVMITYLLIAWKLNERERMNETKSNRVIPSR